MLKVVPYLEKYRPLWDNFIAAAKNGVFMFNRNYMEYHRDRFNDCSLLFFNQDKLLAVFPANAKNDCCASHDGLTFGGVICDSSMKTAAMLKVFELLLNHLREREFVKLVYKPVPHIYHRLPAEEDLYALFRFGAVLSGRQVASSLYPQKRIAYSKGRKACITKANRGALVMQELNTAADFNNFWNMMTAEMQTRRDSMPTHNAKEMILLKESFPRNIRLFGAINNNDLCGGVLIYETDMIAHCQYIAANKAGRAQNALDFLFDRLINQVFADKPCFDWGTSNHDSGRVMDENLILNKESFGGRAVCYDRYEITL